MRRPQLAHSLRKTSTGRLRGGSTSRSLPLFSLLRVGALCFATTVLCVPGCKPGPDQAECAFYDFGLPAGIAPPPHPPEVCVTPARVALGRRLFYDSRLSRNENQSCATCHVQRLAFTDGLARSRGSTGQVHPRNALSLANAGYFSTLTWFHPELRRFDNQVLIPLFAEDTPTTIEELAITGMEWVVTRRLRADPIYPGLFGDAFPGADIDVTHIARALAAFQTTILSYRSPYDLNTMSAEARLGQQLFESDRTGCAGCHDGPNFNIDRATGKLAFHNIGLYNVGSAGDYPDQALHGDRVAPRQTQGLFLVTGDPADRGKFRTPSLRNVALTAPYMHDGSVATLDEVIAILNAGGRDLRHGPLAGDGRTHPNKDPRIRPLGLSPLERKRLRAFLESLTDREFIKDPRLASPFTN